MQEICSDLSVQYQELDQLVATLPELQWRLETPFFGWTIHDQVAHVAFFDHEALLAVEEPARFSERAPGVMKAVRSEGRLPVYTNALLDFGEPQQLLGHWREIRTRLLRRLKAMATGDRIIWYGPDMSARSFATARLMETWAHGQDIFDTLRLKRTNRAGIRHVAHLGVITFGWSFSVRDLKAPDFTPRVELIGPAGERWQWGVEDATERVWGSAEDFCLVVTQRRNVADTSLQWQGTWVEKWLSIAQAFAGIAQSPPKPGARRVDYATAQ